VSQLKKKLEKTLELKNKAVDDQNFEKAASLRNEENRLKAEIERIIDEWRSQSEKTVPTITPEKIAEVLGKLTGVPKRQHQEQEKDRLLNMEKEISKVVVGQDEAVSAISRTLRRSRADMKDPRRPIGSFIFLGPTGVGKTLLAKALAEFIFGDSESLIQIDMSEYMEKFNVSRLIGSPPGYVGHDEGGQLTERVRRHPYSVVLFDEIEKAHPDVSHMLLQILEEGRITDSLGRKVDFRNTIIIMTSNLGADKLAKGGTLGFGGGVKDDSFGKIKEQLLEAAKKRFKPEFINRVNEVLVFHRLERDDLRRIVTMELEKVTSRSGSQNIKLDIDQSAIDFLIDVGYKPEYGARPLNRAIERHIEDPLAEDIIRGRIKSGQTVKVTVDNNKMLFFPIEEEAKPRKKAKKR
jgi:ATP-dependent Clp protease ATP-binding subunit ClpC